MNLFSISAKLRFLRFTAALVAVYVLARQKGPLLAQ